MIASCSSKIINFFFILFIIIFSLSCIITTNYLDFGHPSGYRIIYENGVNIINILLTIVFIIFIYIANKNNFFGVSEKLLLTVETGLFIIFGICLIIMHNGTYLQSDSGNVMDAAYKMFNGDYSVLDFKSYMNANPNNFGLFTIDYLLLKVLKQPLIVATIFRIINIIFSILLFIFIYKITDLLFNDYMINMNLLLLFIGFNHLLFSSMFVYGNVISYSLSIISVYFLLKYFKTGKILLFCVAIITIMLSIFVRKNSLIVLIAEIIFIILYIIKSNKLVDIISIPVICVLLFLTTTGVEKYYGSLVNYDYSKTAMPTITWIAYGLNYDEKTPGRWFDEYDKIHVANNFETDLIKVEAKQFIDKTIEEFVKNPGLALDFFFKKFSSSWSDPRYDSFTRSHNSLNPLLETDAFQDSFTCYWDSWLTIASIGLILLLVTRFKFKLEYMLPALCLIGGFLFHFFWEVKALYCYQYVLFLLPYVALGLSKITQFSKQ